MEIQGANPYHRIDSTNLKSSFDLSFRVACLELVPACRQGFGQLLVCPLSAYNRRIAAGVTDLRRGFDGLSAQVQTVLQQQPFSGWSTRSFVPVSLLM